MRQPLQAVPGSRSNIAVIIVATCSLKMTAASATHTSAPMTRYRHHARGACWGTATTAARRSRRARTSSTRSASSSPITNFRGSPRLGGVLEYRVAGAASHPPLGTLHEFVPNQGDAWRLHARRARPLLRRRALRPAPSRRTAHRPRLGRPARAPRPRTTASSTGSARTSIASACSACAPPSSTSPSPRDPTDASLRARALRHHAPAVDVRLGLAPRCRAPATSLRSKLAKFPPDTRTLAETIALARRRD